MSAKKQTYNFMIAGVGGQGTVLASKLIATAAMKIGCDVRTTETIGMAQRGGSVFGHIRIALANDSASDKINKNILSPLIPLGKADAIIAFEPAEAVRQLPYLKKDGVVISCDTAIKPITGSYEVSVMIDYLRKHAPRLIILDGKRLTQQNAKTLNVSLLGAAAQSGLFPFDADTLSEILPDVLPQHFLEINRKAFELGRELSP